MFFAIPLFWWNSGPNATNSMFRPPGLARSSSLHCWGGSLQICRSSTYCHALEAGRWQGKLLYLAWYSSNVKRQASTKSASFAFGHRQCLEWYHTTGSEVLCIQWLLQHVECVLNHCLLHVCGWVVVLTCAAPADRTGYLAGVWFASSCCSTVYPDFKQRIVVRSNKFSTGSKTFVLLGVLSWAYLAARPSHFQFRCCAERLIMSINMYLHCLGMNLSDATPSKCS